MVGRLGVGLDNIDMAACAARGVVVRPATGANDVSVAEYVIASAMSCCAAPTGRRPTSSPAAGREALMNGREISGKRLGLIGFGSSPARRRAAPARSA